MLLKKWGTKLLLLNISFTNIIKMKRKVKTMRKAVALLMLIWCGVPASLYGQRIFEGEVFYSDSTTSLPDVGSINAAYAAGKTPVGVVYYVDTTGRHGLVVALKDAYNGWALCWYSGNNGSPNRLHLGVQQTSGYVKTQNVLRRLWNDYPAFFQAYYNNFTPPIGSWFLPSYSEICLLYYDLDIVSQTFSMLNNSLYGAELASIPSGGNYWTCDEVELPNGNPYIHDYNAVYVDSHGIKQNCSRDYGHAVRSVLAF